MQLTALAQATLLLTVNLGKADKGGAKPLSNNEWGRFAIWLRAQRLTPADLLSGDNGNLSALDDRTVTKERVRSLLGRGAALGFALEKWDRAGIWVLTRSDPEYPERLKHFLRAACPPVLFGCGNKALLNKGGLAIVGSRNASEEDLRFTTRLGERTAEQGLSVVSGGARGVDNAAIAGALESEGTGVAVLADSLLRTATASRFRKPLMSGDLVLVSPFNPEAGFSAGNAMARNKYIYCLANAAVVISSTPNKGGTWSGAIEAIRGRWVPVWIKSTRDANSGNSLLVERGALSLPDGLDCLLSLSEFPCQDVREPEPETDGSHPSSPTDVEPSHHDQAKLQVEMSDQSIVSEPAILSNDIPVTYDRFLSELENAKDILPNNVDEIARRLGLSRKIANSMLKLAVERGVLNKLSRPVKYVFAPRQPEQASFL